jgi:RHS repeat-associated protein
LEVSMVTNHSHVLIIQECNSGNTPQVTYTRGLDLSGTIEGAGGIGGLLMRSHGYSAGNWSTHNAYHSDANGNVTALMSSAGVLQASYKYNPYGGLISSSGTLAGANTMRFSSKPAIFSATGAWGFYYYGYRFYDPGMQRWLNRDPLGEPGFEAKRAQSWRVIGDSINVVAYLRNEPLSRIDPLGLALFVCSSDAFGRKGINHAYLHNDNPDGPRCGQNGSSGSGNPTNGAPDPSKANNPCNPVTLPEGLDPDEMARCICKCMDKKQQKPLPWFPGLNDCHRQLKGCFKKCGVTYPGAPGGRFD